MSTIDNVFVFKNKLKKQLLLENPNLKDTFLLDASINQAIFEVMKRIFDNEMKKTEKSMEKAFFGDIASNEKDSTYDNEKQKIKRTMKFIEEARYDEGKEFERISGFLPDDFKQLKRKTDSTKSNFESNHYNITDQNKKEISNINKLKIIKSIRNNRIQDVKKVANSKFESLNVTANQTQPFRQTEKDAKIYSQQKSERSCEYDDYKRRKTGADS